MERDIVDIIDKMLEIIPPEHQNSFKAIQQSASFAPPEGMGLWWRRVTEECNYLLEDGLPEEEWQYIMLALLMNKTREELDIFITQQVNR